MIGLLGLSIMGFAGVIGSTNGMIAGCTFIIVESLDAICNAIKGKK